MSKAKSRLQKLGDQLADDYSAWAQEVVSAKKDLEMLDIDIPYAEMLPDGVTLREIQGLIYWAEECSVSQLLVAIGHVKEMRKRFIKIETNFLTSDEAMDRLEERYGRLSMQAKIRLEPLVGEGQKEWNRKEIRHSYRKRVYIRFLRALRAAEETVKRTSSAQALDAAFGIQNRHLRR